MTTTDELNLILTLIRKHNLPLSPILEYAIKEKMEDFSDTNTDEKKENSITEIVKDETFVKQEECLSSQKKTNSSIRGCAIQNEGKLWSIINISGEKVFSTNGKILIIEDNFYRVSYTYSFFSINLIIENEEGAYALGKRILYAQYRSPLYSALDKQKYINQIKSVIFDYNIRDYRFQVEDKWYDSFGNYAEVE